MRKALVISLATGTLLLAGCQKEEPVQTEDAAEADTALADEAAADAPVEGEEPAEDVE